MHTAMWSIYDEEMWTKNLFFYVNVIDSVTTKAIQSTAKVNRKCIKKEQ
jgi:hypothetical protein